MLYTPKKQQKKQDTQNYDWLIAYTEAIGKLLFFFFVQPYKGIFWRIQQCPKHLFYILCVQSIFLLAGHLGMFHWIFNLYQDSFFSKIISPTWFQHVKLITFFAVGHLYCLMWRIPWLRKENFYNRAFTQLGLVPKYNEGKIRFKNDIPAEHDQRCLRLFNPGIPAEEYQAKQKHLEAMLDVNINNISYGKNRRTICITYSKEQFPTIITYKDFYKQHQLKPYEFGIGVAQNGTRITSTLSDMVHLLVAGETGGGKSTFLRTMIVNLLQSKKTIELYLVDLKGGVEFQPFKKYNQVHLIQDSRDLEPVLTTLNQELDRRLHLLKTANVNNVENYESKTKSTIPRIVLVIDECAEIFLTSSSYDRATKLHMNDLRLSLGRLARLARVVGIHLVLATQRADKQAIDMQTKDNLVSRLCFRVNNDYASQMVLRDGRAAKLPKVQGRAIWKLGNEEIEVQVPYLKQEEIQKLIDNERTIEYVTPDNIE